MAETTFSNTEYAVLGLLAEQPSHGFAISKELSAKGQVGRILTVRRPLVYRALDRLVEQGLARPTKTEPGDAGPQRVVLQVTAEGGRVLDRWLQEPVAHVREIRLAFLLKLVLLQRAGISPLPLIRRQLDALSHTLDALASAETDDPVELWRQQNAKAVDEYLRILERNHRS